jgi:hypothetical protein
MCRIIEVFWSEDIGYINDSILVDKNGTENSSFSFDRMWGRSEGQVSIVNERVKVEKMK